MTLIKLYQVELPNAVFGIEVQDNTVTGAAPLGQWMVGLPLARVERWAGNHNGWVEFIEEFTI